MIPVTGAGWSQVSGVGGVTGGASATATEDRIVVPRASADGAAGASVEPGVTHGHSESLGFIPPPGGGEDSTATPSQVPVDARHHPARFPQCVREGGVGTARGGFES